MTTSILDRLGVDLERVDRRAQQISPRKLAISLVTLPFIIVGLVLAGGWTLVAWMLSGVNEGYTIGRDAIARATAELATDRDDRTVGRGG
jgi:hypothetical protein